MATIYYTPAVKAQSYIFTIQVTAYDAATTYSVTIGNLTISVTGDTDVNTTTANLAAELAAATSPLFSEITWTSSTDTITGTGKPGIEHTVATAEAGGTGTIADPVTSQAATGPSHADAGGNWSGGSVPANSDVVVFPAGDYSVCWGLDASGVTPAQVIIEPGFVGQIGLRHDQLATSEDGKTTTPAVPEYRETHYKIGVTIGTIRGHSPMVNLDSGTTATIYEISNTGRNPWIENGYAVNIKANSASTDIHCPRAPGGVGVAMMRGDETSTIRDFSIGPVQNSARFALSTGVTFTDFYQSGGESMVGSAGTPTRVDVYGGVCMTHGDMVITTANVTGGTLIANHYKTSGTDKITTLNVESGGTVDFSQSQRVREIGTLNAKRGATIIRDPDVLTWNAANWGESSKGPVRISVA